MIPGMRIAVVVMLCCPMVVRAQGMNVHVSDIINAMSLDSLMTSVSGLSGEVPVVIDGIPQTIASRCDGTPGNALAPLYIAQRLEAFGLMTAFQDFSPAGGRNVLAVQPGLERPGQCYMICAHYDDAPWGATAPGADDNASGTAAVIEAARILGHYRTGFSIIYALWDREELGLLGSSVYATAAAGRGDSILGVINLDMVSWDGNDDFAMDIHARNVSSSMAISDTVQFVNTTYGIGVLPTVRTPGTNASDHASFWNAGYAAVLLIESGNDFNTHYHTTGDLLSACNGTYFHKMAKVAVGTLATLANVLGPTGVTNDPQQPARFVLHQNYPNPFNPSTTIDYQLAGPGRVLLEIYDVLGRKVSTLVDGTQEGGSHRVIWNAHELASGMYLCRFTVDLPGRGDPARIQARDNEGSHHVETKKMALLR